MCYLCCYHQVTESFKQIVMPLGELNSVAALQH
jgi:hypothetical protein